MYPFHGGYNNPGDLSGGWTYFLFSPYLGKISNWTSIFQMGWNHQPVMVEKSVSNPSFLGWMSQCHNQVGAQIAWVEILPPCSMNSGEFVPGFKKHL